MVFLVATCTHSEITWCLWGGQWNEDGISLFQWRYRPTSCPWRRSCSNTRLTADMMTQICCLFPFSFFSTMKWTPCPAWRWLCLMYSCNKNREYLRVQHNTWLHLSVSSVCSHSNRMRHVATSSIIPWTHSFSLSDHFLSPTGKKTIPMRLLSFPSSVHI